jgi:hypothetical protein
MNGVPCSNHWQYRVPMANVRVAQHRLSNHDHKADERAEAPVVPRRMVAVAQAITIGSIIATEDHPRKVFQEV